MNQHQVDRLFTTLTEEYQEKGLQSQVARKHARQDLARLELKDWVIPMSYNDLKRALQVALGDEGAILEIYPNEILVGFEQANYIGEYILDRVGNVEILEDSFYLVEQL